MQFANEFTTHFLSNPEEMLPLAINMCQLAIPQWYCSIRILLRLEMITSPQPSDWSIHLQDSILIDQDSGQLVCCKSNFTTGW